MKLGEWRPSHRCGERFQIAVFGINGPIFASPANYIWMRHREWASNGHLQLPRLHASGRIGGQVARDRVDELRAPSHVARAVPFRVTATPSPATGRLLLWTVAGL